MRTAPMHDMSRTIVHIDDDPAILDLVSASLSEPGSIEVISVRDGNKAVEVIGRRRPDLILCDIGLPERDGFSVVEELRRWPTSIDAPVIFVSALADEAQIDRAFGIGAADFIKKPFRPTELKARVLARLGAHSAAKSAGSGAPGSADVRGSLAMMSVGDLFNAVELGRKSGVLKLSGTESSGTKLAGEIRFKAGRVVAASCDGITNEAAAYRLGVLADGDFEMRFLPEKEVEGKLDLSPQFLLMEACRLQDEGTLVQPKPPTPSHPPASSELAQLLARFDALIAYAQKTSHASVVRNYLEESRRILPRQWRESCQVGSGDGSLEGTPVIIIQPGAPGSENLVRAWVSEFIKRGQYSEPKAYGREAILAAGILDAPFLDKLGIR